MANLVTRTLAALMLVSCAQERPIEHVLPEYSRIAKEHLQGTFVFLKSVPAVEAPGEEHRSYVPGMHLESDHLVQFVFRENQMDLVSVDPLFETESAAQKNETLASFPAQHVDVQRKDNENGEPTHEEEETQSKRTWNQRSFVKFNLTQDLVDPLQAESQTSAIQSPLELDLVRSAINFSVKRILKDGTGLTVHYSLLKYTPSPTYEQRAYSEDEQRRFGFFKTTTFRFNAFDQITESTRQEYMNRWDTSKTIRWYLSGTFPEHLKIKVRRLFSEWASRVKQAVGDVVLELHETRGQQLGDLRFNTIHYDESEHSSHGALGYAPLVTNPRTGEILKADVILFSKVLKRSAFQELFWESSRLRHLGEDPAPASPADTFTLPIVRLKQSSASDLSNRFTRINEDVVTQVLKASRARLPWETVENRILGGVFGHEFGHSLGLAHNFIASADHAHLATGNASTSIMDYGFLHGKDAQIGPYDASALLFAYSSQQPVRESQLAQGFYFCSDADVFSSRNPLCQQYDTASTLKELVDNQLDQYLAGYEVNNQRLERVGFPSDVPSYDKRILSFLLPIRLVYDNAHALVQASSRRDLVSLWRLAGPRIEGAPGRRTIEVDIVKSARVTFEEGTPKKLATTFKVYLDPMRIEAVVQDATRAKKAAVAALRHVVLDSKRPNFDQVDPLNEDVDIRGVLKDKMLALTLLALPLEHPLKKGSVISPYSVIEKTVPRLFASLLSNTTVVEDPEGGEETYFRIREVEMQIREYALQLLAEKVARVEGHPEARNLIQVQPLAIRERDAREANWQKLTEARTDLRNAYRDKLIDKLLKPGIQEEDVALFFSNLSPFDKARNQFNVAFTELDDDTLYTAPVLLPGEDIHTASGLLIRNNLNVAKDYLAAVTDVMGQIEQDIFKIPVPLNVMLVLMPLLKERQEMLSRHVNREQLFLQQMYLAFTRKAGLD